MPKLTELKVKDGLIEFKNDAQQNLSVKIADYKTYAIEHIAQGFQRLELRPMGLTFNASGASVVLSGPNDFEVTMLATTFIGMHRAIFAGHTYGFRLGSPVDVANGLPHPCRTCGSSKNTR